MFVCNFTIKENEYKYTKIINSFKLKSIYSIQQYNYEDNAMKTMHLII